jgi:5-hydroxyisourate hydrolase
MKGKLSTHVLDIENGVAAGGLSIALWRVDPEERVLLKEVVTNPEGRTDEPLLSGGEMKAGEYEMVFQVGAYFELEPEKSFLNAVPIRFRIVNPNEGYHVPLLVSRWAYNTYRGS